MEERAKYIIEKIDNSLSTPNKLKRVVIREELQVLTGHWLKALILNQFLHWSERTKDADKYIREESDRLQLRDMPIQLTHGWIYKKADQLNNELMVDMSVATIRKYIKELVADGYLDERSNPKHSWDRTLQYRPNFIKILMGCLEQGYILEGYKWTVPMLKILRNAILENKIGSLESKTPTDKNSTAVPKTITETITEEIVSSGEKNSPEQQPDKNELPNKEKPVKRKNADSKNDNDDNVKKPPNELYEIVMALCQVCKMDFEANKGRLFKEAKLLSKATPTATPELIEQYYDNDGWWEKEDWRGKKGDLPSPHAIRETWGQWIDYRTELTEINQDGSIYV